MCSKNFFHAVTIKDSSNDDPNHVKISDDEEESFVVASGSEIVPFWFDSFDNKLLGEAIFFIETFDFL